MNEFNYKRFMPLAMLSAAAFFCMPNLFSYTVDFNSESSLIITEINKIEDSIKRADRNYRNNFKDIQRYLEDFSSVNATFKGELIARNQHFMALLTQYKPLDHPWIRFNPLEYHKVDKRNPRALYNFLVSSAQLRAKLSASNAQLYDLKSRVRDASASLSYRGQRLMKDLHLAPETAPLYREGYLRFGNYYHYPRLGYYYGPYRYSRGSHRFYRHYPRRYYRRHGPLRGQRIINYNPYGPAHSIRARDGKK